MPVRSRVSWGAIFAGAVIALTVNLILSALGIALGLSVSGSVGERELGIGAAVWAVAAALLSLFAGGCVTSQCTVGEDKPEAMVHGVIMWGVVFAALLSLMAGGVRVGFNTVMGMASSPVTATLVNRLSEEDLRAAGFTPDQITGMRQQFDQLRAQGQNLSGELRNAAEDPRARSAAWWTFAGILLSMLAAVAGSLAGAGPTLYLTRVRLRAPGLGLPHREAVAH
jgi:hypothetical protein